jgi:hypothetical protein
MWDISRLTTSLLGITGSYVDYTCNSNKSDTNMEHGDSPGSNDTIKITPQFAHQFRPKVTQQPVLVLDLPCLSQPLNLNNLLCQVSRWEKVDTLMQLATFVWIWTKWFKQASYDSNHGHIDVIISAQNVIGTFWPHWISSEMYCRPTVSVLSVLSGRPVVEPASVQREQCWEPVGANTQSAALREQKNERRPVRAGAQGAFRSHR